MKFNLSLSILLFTLVSLSSCSEDENSLMNIVQVSGLLYEKKSQQDIILVSSRTNLEPTGFKQVIIKNEEKMDIFPTPIKCDYKSLNLPFYQYMKCKIDLEKVPSGFYRIILITYKGFNLDNKNMIPFRVMKDDSEFKPLQLIDFIATNITDDNEYKPATLIFSDIIKSSRTDAYIIFIGEKNEHIGIQFSCSGIRNESEVKCHSDFKGVKEGKYLIESVEYNYKNILPSRNIYLTVSGRKENLELINIEGKIVDKRALYNMNFTFNKEIFIYDISKFILYNETVLYELWNRYTQNINETTISVDFQIYIPEGNYHLGMTYKGKEYRFSNLFINVRDHRYYNYYASDLKNIIYSLSNPKKEK